MVRLRWAEPALEDLLAIRSSLPRIHQLTRSGWYVAWSKRHDLLSRNRAVVGEWQSLTQTTSANCLFILIESCIRFTKTFAPSLAWSTLAAIWENTSVPKIFENPTISMVSAACALTARPENAKLLRQDDSA